MAFFGTPAKTKQFPIYNQQQQSALNQSLGQAMSYLNNPATRPGFEPIANRAREQFQTNTIPSIAARFSSMGTGGNLRSSAFNQALGSAGSDLESQLAALGSQHSLQQQGLDQNMLFNLLKTGLQPQNENVYIPGQPGFLEGAGSGLLQGLGSLGGLAGGGGILGLLMKLLGGNRLGGGNQFGGF